MGFFMKKLVLVLSLFVSSFAIVTIAPAEPSDEKEYDLVLKTFYNQTSGNTDTLTYKLSAKATRYHKNYVTFINASYLYAEANSVKSKDEFYTHARFIYKLNELNALETFGQIEAYPFKAIELRSLVGAGDRLKFDFDTTKIFLGVGAYTSVVKEANENSINENRVNTYLSLTGEFDALGYALSGYYQPNIASFDDTHMIGNFELEFGINKQLKLTFEVSATYDSQPATGKKTYDLTQLYGIVYTYNQ